MQKPKLKSYFSLFTPSPLGIVFYVFWSVLAIALNQIDAIQKVLQLPRGLDFIGAIARFADRVLTSAIGESSTQTLVVGLFWAGVGMVVYVFLRALSKLVVELDDDIDERRYVWPKGMNRSGPLLIFIEKGILRTVAAIALILTIIGPLATVISRPVFTDFLGSNKPLQYIVWFISSVIVWHVVVVLLRLVVLRARLFE
ncbi:MAG TPA: hypothetical protein VF575_05230 [Candidatus Saccharimonadales bacterium]|jgi:hypothetical protein